MEQGTASVPRILVFSTHTISDPGIDLAGSAHMHYSPGVMTVSIPCTSLLTPDILMHALRQGFDGVFVASDGVECAYLPDCAERSSRVFAETQARMELEGYDARRLRMAALCSVCAGPFVTYMREFDEVLNELGPA